MSVNNLPPVTIGVLTYNSSKYVIETLESIKAQTYPNIILQISDDCSTDKTIEICKNWIEKNKERFVKTKIIVPKHNTGVSANANRNWDACETEWFKSIAGDDLLLPNCIEDNMKYVEEHPDAIFVFSKPKAFGVSKKKCELYLKRRFDYSFFSMEPEMQYDKIRYGSCLPAAAVFSNINKIRDIGLRHDERIPLLEDRPKWLNAIKLGIKFHFYNKETVAYRIREDSLSNKETLSPLFYKSTRLCYYYYTFQPSYHNNPDKAIYDAVLLEMEQYQRYLDCKKQRDYFYNLIIVRLIRNFKHNIIKFITKK